MQFPPSIRRLLLACCLVTALPGCVKVERINPAGEPIDKPIVGTHVSPPARP